MGFEDRFTFSFFSWLRRVLRSISARFLGLFFPMDCSTGETSSVQVYLAAGQATSSLGNPPVTYQRQRHCPGNAAPGDFPLSDSPSIVLHILTSCNFDPLDLAKLEATCSFFRQPANLTPDYALSIVEIAALDICQKRAIFKPMTTEERQGLRQICGGSWKLVLKFLLAGEACYRREKSQVVAGPGHSIFVTNKGRVYSFGYNDFGQLGHGTTRNVWRPQLIRTLQNIRIIHATVGAGRTMLVSDTGRVFAFGKDCYAESDQAPQPNKLVTVPLLVESLKNIFVVQVAIGNFFTAVLSREGRVYTFCWGDENKLAHRTQLNDIFPRPLLGALENLPVVQISAGYCYLLALAFQPSGMSVYSLGCGLGGKLGHGCKTEERQPRLIEHFATLNFQPIAVAAGTWHAAALAKDGRVCTWGWGQYGCLGHGTEECECLPRVVETLNNVKAVHVATGDNTTFVVSENGDVYSFGCGESANLGHNAAIPAELQGNNVRIGVLRPRLVSSLKQMKEMIAQISLTNIVYWNSHTLALTESDKLYAFGAGDGGQLGVELEPTRTDRADPMRVDVQ